MRVQANPHSNMKSVVVLDTLLGAMPACHPAPLKPRMRPTFLAAWRGFKPKDLQSLEGKATYFISKNPRTQKAEGVKLQLSDADGRGFLVHLPIQALQTGEFTLVVGQSDVEPSILISGFDAALIPIWGTLHIKHVSERFVDGTFSLVLRDSFGRRKNRVQVQSSFQAQEGWPNFDLLLGGLHINN